MIYCFKVYNPISKYPLRNYFVFWQKKSNVCIFIHVHCILESYILLCTLHTPTNANHPRDKCTYTLPIHTDRTEHPSRLRKVKQ